MTQATKSGNILTQDLKLVNFSIYCVKTFEGTVKEIASILYRYQLLKKAEFLTVLNRPAFGSTTLH